MATITLTPTNPVVGQPVTLTFAADAGGNYVRVWCTDAPSGSKLKAELDTLGAARVSFAELDIDARREWTPDIGGAYVFLVQELTQGASAYGGGYDYDPNRAPSEVLVGVYTRTVYVASPLKTKLGAGSDLAEMLVYVWNDVLIETRVVTHGVKSPVLQKAATPKAKLATVDATVLAAVDAMVGVSVATLIGSISTAVTDLIAKFNAHRTQAGVHAANDGDNAVSTAFTSPGTADAQRQSLTALRQALDRHMRNDAAGAGTGTASYHSGADWANQQLPAAPTDLASTLALLADCWRAFEAHRVSSVHSASDTVNTASALSPLLGLHKAFVAQLATVSPTVPATEHSAKATLVAAAGFQEV